MELDVNTLRIVVTVAGLVLFLLLVWGIVCFIQNDFWILWPLHVIKFMGELSAGLLFIPLLQILLQADCSTAHTGVPWGFEGKGLGSITS